jgi:hypothetical protein
MERSGNLEILPYKRLGSWFLELSSTPEQLIHSKSRKPLSWRMLKRHARSMALLARTPRSLAHMP